MKGELFPWRREELEATCGQDVRELLGGVASDNIQEVLDGSKLAEIASYHEADIEELQALAWAIMSDAAVMAAVE